MKIILKIAYGYLLSFKRQSFYTIVSIMLSALLVTFLCATVTTTLRCSGSIAIGVNGNAHATFSVPAENAQDIARNVAFEEADIFESIIVLCASENLPEVVTKLDYDDCELGGNYTAHIKTGRLPEKNGEIALPLSTNASTGDRVCYADGGSARAEFVVCGLIDEYCAFIYRDDDSLDCLDTIKETRISVRFKLSTEKIEKIVCDVLDDYNVSGGDCFIDENRSVTRAELVGGNAWHFFLQILAAVLTAIFLLLFCCRMMINCSFEIISRQSITQYGILKTTGISSYSLTFVAFLQSSLLALVGIIPGVGGGLALSATLYRRIVNSDEFSEMLRSTGVDFAQISDFYIYKPLVYIIPAVILAWSVFSAVGTARRTIRRYPAETLCDDSAVIVFKPSKRYRIIGRIGGCMGKIAVQSRYINRKRSRAAVVSIAMSVTLGGVFSAGIMIFRDSGVFSNALIYAIVLKTISCFLAIFITLCAVNTANIIFSDIHSRRKEISLMRAMGMSDKQLLGTILLECALYVFSALSVSVVAAAVISEVIFIAVNNNPCISPHYLLTAEKNVLLSGVGAAVLTAICALIPLRHVSRDNIIEQLRHD